MICWSCVWVSVQVQWARLFPVRSQLRRIEHSVRVCEALIRNLNLKEARIMSEVAKLSAALDALRAKVDETNVTLKALAEAVIEAGVDESTLGDLVVKAEGILADLDAAESAADDALPAA